MVLLALQFSYRETPARRRGLRSSRSFSAAGDVNNARVAFSMEELSEGAFSGSLSKDGPSNNELKKGSEVLKQGIYRGSSSETGSQRAALNAPGVGGEVAQIQPVLLAPIDGVSVKHVKLHNGISSEQTPPSTAAAFLCTFATALQCFQ